MSGYRTALLLWFFLGSIEHSTEGAWIKMVVGPFASVIECKMAKSVTVDALELIGANYKLSECFNKELT